MARRFIREYFNFTTREKNGLIVLFIILFIITSSNIIVKNQRTLKKVDFTEFEEEIDRFLSSNRIDASEIELSYFDPNTASRDELEKLGLAQNVVNNILNYRERGGRFFNAESFKRIYGLEEEEFERVKDYILIESNRRSGRHSRGQTQREQAYELFYFDPNTATKQEFIKLGLREWQADNIKRFRERGGQFNEPKDFAIIYGLSESKFNELKPYIQIDQSQLSERTSGIDSDKPKESVIVEINSADAVELQTISGIGPAFSDRIIRYRESLRGFYDVKQLKEVFGFTEEMFNQISPQTEVNPEYINKINLNDAEYRDLISHPYIDRQAANTIMEYKRFVGEILDMEELIKQRVIDRDLYDKLIWYFTVQ